MRVAWIALGVISLDILSKFVLTNTSLGGRFIPWEGVVLELVHSKSANVPHYLMEDVNLTGWLLLVGVLILFPMLFRKSDIFSDASPLASTGIQLAAGGIICQVTDLFLYGSITPILLFISPLGHFNSGISDLAILGGLGTLIFEFIQHRLSGTPAIALQPGRDLGIDLAALPRGVDNVHIDVVLSHSFKTVACGLIHDLVPRYIKQIKIGGKRIKLPKGYYNSLQQAYVAMVQLATRRAKETGEQQTLELLQAAVIKFLHHEINKRTTAAVQKFSETLHEDQKRGAGGGDANAHVQWLFRNRSLVCYRVGEGIFGALVQCEQRLLNTFRRSLFGNYRSIAADALHSPLIQGGSGMNEIVQLEHYCLLGQLDSDRNSFPRLDATLAKAFDQALAFVEASGDYNESELPLADGEGIKSEYLRALAHPSVLMNRHNVTTLLDRAWTRNEIVHAPQRKRRQETRRLRRHLRFQANQMLRFKMVVEQAKLLPHIIASYELAHLFKDKQWDVSVQLLHKNLTQDGPRPEIKRRLQGLLRGLNAPDVELLMEAWDRVHRPRVEEIPDVLLRFARDFSAYRRDLLLEYTIQQAVNQIALLEDEKDIRTSRANFTLHEFTTPEESNATKRTIRSHAIVKADLRGSTQITDRLVELHLNPAAHFSRYFFDPINAIIELYGAEKVFIEGDAVILILNEYRGDHNERLIVARACGLAAGIIQVVGEQNKHLVAHGLPTLELGIGISYQDNAPRFLFDGNNRITISPAINRADRLSACAWAVRQWVKEQQADIGHAAVFEPSAKAAAKGEKAQKDLVYNLNGILLEPEAFEKLKKEVQLRQLRNSLPHSTDSTLHASRYPDITGTFHVLVVREAPVRTYDDGYTLDQCPRVEGRTYYEVIHDRYIIQRLRDSLAAAASVPAEP